MKSFYILMILPLMLSANTESSMVIYSDKGASKWDEGYPVGNGRIGLMTLGTYPTDTYYFNENSIWAKQGVDYPENGAENMAKIRELASEGKYKEADELFATSFMDPAWRPESYEYAGHATLEHLELEKPQSIENTLNLRTGLSRSVATYADGVITREAVALRDRDVIAINLSSTRSAGLNFKLKLEHPRDSITAKENSLVLSGQAAHGGTSYQSTLVVKEGREIDIKRDEGSLTITADGDVLLLYSATTDFNIQNPEEPLSEWNDKDDQFISSASNVTWETLLEEATGEMSPYIDRMKIDLGTTAPEVAKLPTAERIKLYAEGGNDPDYEELLFNFGRYCIVATNRESGLPNNLQGIWSEGLKAAWSGDYHLNINLQMNYWPVDTTALGEFHQPMLDLIGHLQPSGKKLAESIGHEGFACGHAVNAWFNTWFSSPWPQAGASVMNGAWITAHLMEHYRFTNDQEFLKNQAWPLIQENARFVLSWLHKDPETNKWITGPGTSPENAFLYKEDGKHIRAAVTNGTTHDLMIAWESLSDLIEAAEELGLENELTRRTREVLPDLTEGQIGEDGRLLEWREAFDEKFPGHRHVSHAYGFFPSRQYNIIEHPEKVAAIEKTLDHRLANGGGHTGWSRAWLINIEACLQRPEAAYANIRTMLSKLINPNLFDMHPPFQIDGNFGYTSGVVMMLLQSQIQLDSGERVLWILPALPEAWPTGEIHGLKTRGGATVDLKWSSERVDVRVSGDRNEDYMIRFGDQMLPLPEDKSFIKITAPNGEFTKIEIY